MSSGLVQEAGSVPNRGWLSVWVGPEQIEKDQENSVLNAIEFYQMPLNSFEYHWIILNAAQSHGMP